MFLELTTEEADRLYEILGAYYKSVEQVSIIAGTKEVKKLLEDVITFRSRLCRRPK